MVVPNDRKARDEIEKGPRVHSNQLAYQPTLSPTHIRCALCTHIPGTITVCVPTVNYGLHILVRADQSEYYNAYSLIQRVNHECMTIL